MLRPEIKGVSIPDPNKDPVAEARASYTLYYKHEDSDSPGKSRRSLIERVRPHICSLPPNSWILDLGSGKQLLEKEYGSPPCRFVTLDIADLKRDQLLTQECRHIQATGWDPKSCHGLPFPDNTFSLGISSMALDFMPEEARDELYRVLKPEAYVFLNLHHPRSIIPTNLDEKIKRMYRKIFYQKCFRKEPTEKQKLMNTALLQKRYLRDNEKLFGNPNQIREVFEGINFRIERLFLNEDSETKWWEVDMVRKGDEENGES